MTNPILSFTMNMDKKFNANTKIKETNMIKIFKKLCCLIFSSVIFVSSSAAVISMRHHIVQSNRIEKDVCADRDPQILCF